MLLSSGHYSLNAACSDSKDPPRGHVEPPGGFAVPSGRMANGGGCLPGSGLGLCRFDAPRNFNVCRDVMRRAAMESIAENTRRIAREFRANWGRASARQPSRIALDAGGAIKWLLDFVGRVAGQCELCQAFGKLLTFLLLGRLRRPRPMRDSLLTFSFG